MSKTHNNSYQNAYLTEETYLSLYESSVKNPTDFWQKRADELISFHTPATTIQSGSLIDGKIRWFEGATLNVCYNCVDRHLDTHGDQTAIIWEGDDPNLSKTFTYKEAHQQVCRFANLLKHYGVQKGDRVCIYLPMIPEAAFAMLACARIGAIHSVVFGGFSPQSLEDRILDADCNLVITADESVRGGKRTPLKENVDRALKNCPNVTKVIVVKRTHAQTQWDATRDVDYQSKINAMSDACPCEILDAEDPLFILYTSGSTGKPKGVLHTQAGYLLFTALTHKYAFNYQPGDIYWCTADVGWITGHSYIVYGPMANAATTVMFEGIPTYPDASRCWQVVDKHKVNIFYTAPTAIRALMGANDAFVKQTDRSSLKILGTVGEPINPEAWEWYYSVVGENRCPIIDTWWQTETGGFMITPLPNVGTLKPGSATRPFFGIKPALIDDTGNILEGEAEGKLVITDAWPSMLRTVYGNHERFLETYLKPFPGFYFTGDGARRDAQGYYWITGRVDDVLVISGHNLGSAEIESAISANHKVVEAAVVGVPHDIKGNAVYAFIVTAEGVTQDETLIKELNAQLRKEIGPIAKCDYVQWTTALPKTRSGKIMRRILRKIANCDFENLGDTSTLADPSVVEVLIKNRR